MGIRWIWNKESLLLELRLIGLKDYRFIGLFLSSSLTHCILTPSISPYKSARTLNPGP